MVKPLRSGVAPQSAAGEPEEGGTAMCGPKPGPLPVCALVEGENARYCAPGNPVDHTNVGSWGR